MLMAYFLVLTVESVWAASHGGMPTKRMVLAGQLVGSVVIAWWVMQDSVRYGIGRPSIFGLFLFAAWPFVGPFHLWRTRRWRALITVLIFVGLWILAALPYVVQDVRDIAASANQ